MLFSVLADTSAEVGAAAGRLRKVELLAGCLRGARADEVGLVVSYLAGELRQRRPGVGPAALRRLGEPAPTPTLTVSEVDQRFERLASLTGAGSQARRAALLEDLFGRATAGEQRFLAGLIGGEIRQGALEGVMTEAVARATGIPVAEVRRALMLRGSLPAVAEAAASGGRDALAAFRLEVGRPLQPMLAQSADGVAAALERIQPAAVEEKLDGVRIQVHRDGSDVAVFTRTLDEITSRVPAIVEAVLALPVRAVVLDGEALALFHDGRPRPFATTASRVATRAAGTTTSRAALAPYFFDLLHLDGEDLLDAPGADRHAALAAVVPQAARVPRLVTADVAEAGAFLDATLARGHEGVVVKALDAPYEAGRRGAGWLKVKPVHTLDLVVLAAEWGHGRRRGWLSNLHLGARMPGGLDVPGGPGAPDAPRGFVMLGKTFKGLTDAMLAEQTQRLLDLEVSRDDWTVHVRPELVVEIAFDGVQTSPRYPGGLALRFARVLRYRPDKQATDADTLDAVRALHVGSVRQTD